MITVSAVNPDPTNSTDEQACDMILAGVQVLPPDTKG